jgi:2,3,4,5-tetrahydropyridine-2-carboxylate N-succinyltransferase
MDDSRARALIERANQALPEAEDEREELVRALDHVLEGLEEGRLRVARPETGWATELWIRSALLLLFRLRPALPVHAGPWTWHDKIDLQIDGVRSQRLIERGVRLVPPAFVRRGAYVGARAVLMPSYVNLGAYVGEDTLVDTWATVGSCAQIGARVHLSGGVGIGGVLEPVQARPVVVEDDCFVGARSEIVDGVRVRRGAVLGMGVFLGASTKIYDRATGAITYGEIPEYAVVVPGTLPSSGGCQLACAVIVKRVDARTRMRTEINALLRT